MCRLLIVLVLGLMWLLSACSEGVIDASESAWSISPVTRTVAEVRYPTSETDFNRLYRDRGFLAAGNHLGHDVALSEGTAIHPIACGRVRIYRPASGYGTLAVVVEHQLVTPLTVTNGVGSLTRVTNFLSIYGHLRPTSLANSQGMRATAGLDSIVCPNDIIGYVENDEANGDGAEHLHLGIRLQTTAEAMQTDPRAWFRGYDGTPSMARYYADPRTFMATLMSGVSSVPDAGSPSMTPVDAGFCQASTETCDGLDNDCDGLVDENQGEFTCGVGLCRRTVTACSNGSWNRCITGDPAPEICGNSLDEDCDGSDRMCSNPPSIDAGSPNATGSIRYEFRVLDSSGWGASEPFRLRDQYWSMQTCQNTSSINLQLMPGGWRRCDLGTRLSPFVGSFFSPAHTDWGDQGHIGTVGISPARCTPTNGVEWRITDLATGNLIFAGPSADLPCASVGSQDRHRLP